MSGSAIPDGRDSQRHDRGRAMYAAQFGIDEAEVDVRLAEIVGAKMAAESIVAAGGYAWNDGALSTRERCLLVIASLATQGGVERRLRGHLRWALEQGIAFDDLESALILLANYAGQPRASVAMELLREVAGLGACDAPAGLE